MPSLVLQAGDDRITDVTATREFCQRARPGVVEYREYPGFHHEIMNEVGRERVFGDIAAWLATRFPANVQ